jgi:CDP-glucose 4,6-dehydratase
VAEPDEWTDELRRTFSGRSVLLTGHTGFKGSWLALWLHHLGAKVTGFALDPPTDPSNYRLALVGDVLAADQRADIRDSETVARVFRDVRPDIVLHLAAQTIVLDSYLAPVESFDVNVVGTAVVLDALRTIDHPCAVVVVTSDKCYANDESGRRFTEGDPLGGHDPYSASKAGTELVAAAYRSSFFRPEDLDQHGVAIATARAGNVIGGGDWTGHGIVADIVRSIDKRRMPASGTSSGWLLSSQEPIPHSRSTRSVSAPTVASSSGIGPKFHASQKSAPCGPSKRAAKVR